MRIKKRIESLELQIALLKSENTKISQELDCLSKLVMPIVTNKIEQDLNGIFSDLSAAVEKIIKNEKEDTKTKRPVGRPRKQKKENN